MTQHGLKGDETDFLLGMGLTNNTDLQMCSSKRAKFEGTINSSTMQKTKQTKVQFVVIISIILLIHCDLSNKHP